MSSSMTLGRPLWRPLAAAIYWASRVLSRMHSRSSCAPTARTANSIAPIPLGSWMPVNGPGEQLQLDVLPLQRRRQQHQLCGVTRQPPHLAHGQDHVLVGRRLFDVAGELQRLRQLRPHLDPGRDLLREEMRYDWADVHDRPCAVAAEVAEALIARGRPAASLCACAAAHLPQP
ncbi:MAG: hypothetical protein JWN00_4531, partial [Actinomycetia bacterium]|nr:hypothetical protein [Actinomycetes bacterium]